jgi:hypothetical protein
MLQRITVLRPPRQRRLYDEDDSNSKIHGEVEKSDIIRCARSGPSCSGEDEKSDTHDSIRRVLVEIYLRALG